MMMWPQQTYPMHNMPMGGRPLVHGFHPDGFGYPPNGFGAPDIFGSRAMFAALPYGPRFPGDFGGGAGLMFPGRPPFPMGGGFGPFGMLMGNAGRAPFMGGFSRPGRPPFLHQPPSNNHHRMVKTRQATNDRYEPTPDQGGGGGGGRNDKLLTSGTTIQNDESESEDEAAPRR